ncbi:MAG: hypothetical protein KIT20_12050, partial [Alphaproteobacteria bacterium]|nr:hypothetical protein [Alphaproteobacteria bacterium]
AWPAGAPAVDTPGHDPDHSRMEHHAETRLLRRLALMAAGAGALLALLPADAALAALARGLEDGLLPGFTRLLYSGFLCF